MEQTNDQTTKRQVVELLVRAIRIDTTAAREVRATITYAFTPQRVAIDNTACSDGICYTLTRVVAEPVARRARTAQTI